MKSISAVRLLLIDAHGDLDFGLVVEFVGVLAVVQGGDDPAHRVGRVALDVTHVRLDDVEAEMFHHVVQFFDALLVRGDLGAQVGEVRGRVAGRVLGGSQEVHGLGFPEARVLDEQPVVDQHPLLLDPGAERGHRSRGHAADLGVMPPRRHEKPDVWPRRFWPRRFWPRRWSIVVALATTMEHRCGCLGARGEDGRDYCDVGEMSASVVGVVEDVDVAAADASVAALIALDHHLDRLAHGAQVHRHVRGVGDQAALGVEDRAGEIEPLLDVDRVRGRLQPHPHLLGDRHEQVVEDLEQHRVGGGARAGLRGPGLDTGEQQVAAVAHHGLPARFDHRGGEFLGDDGRAVDGVPGP